MACGAAVLAAGSVGRRRRTRASPAQVAGDDRHTQDAQEQSGQVNAEERRPVVDVGRAHEQQTSDQCTQRPAPGAPDQLEKQRTQAEGGHDGEETAREKRWPEDSYQGAGNGLQEGGVVGEDVWIAVHAFVNAAPLGQQPRLMEHKPLTIVQLVGIGQGHSAQMQGDGQVEDESREGSQPQEPAAPCLLPLQAGADFSTPLLTQPAAA